MPTATTALHWLLGISLGILEEDQWFHRENLSMTCRCNFQGYSSGPWKWADGELRWPGHVCRKQCRDWGWQCNYDSEFEFPFILSYPCVSFILHRWHAKAVWWGDSCCIPLPDCIMTHQDELVVWWQAALCLCSQQEFPVDHCSCPPFSILSGLLSSKSNGFLVVANVVPCVWPPGSCHAASGRKRWCESHWQHVLWVQGSSVCGRVPWLREYEIRTLEWHPSLLSWAGGEVGIWSQMHPNARYCCLSCHWQDIFSLSLSLGIRTEWIPIFEWHMAGNKSQSCCWTMSIPCTSQLLWCHSVSIGVTMLPSYRKCCTRRTETRDWWFFWWVETYWSMLKPLTWKTTPFWGMKFCQHGLMSAFFGPGPEEIMLPYVYKQQVEHVEKEEIYSPGYQGPGGWWCTVTYSMRWSHTIQFRRASQGTQNMTCPSQMSLSFWGWLGDAQLVLSEHLVDACSSTSWNCLNMCATWVLCAGDCGREVLKDFLRCWEIIRAEDLCLEERRPLGGCCTVAGSAETLGATLGIRCVRRISHKFDVEPAWSHWCIAIDLINHRREQEISLK